MLYVETHEGGVVLRDDFDSVELSSNAWNELMSPTFSSLVSDMLYGYPNLWPGWQHPVHLEGRFYVAVVSCGVNVGFCERNPETGCLFPVRGVSIGEDEWRELLLLGFGE